MPEIQKYLNSNMIDSLDFAGRFTNGTLRLMREFNPNDTSSLE